MSTSGREGPEICHHAHTAAHPGRWVSGVRLPVRMWRLGLSLLVLVRLMLSYPRLASARCAAPSLPLPALEGRWCANDDMWS